MGSRLRCFILGIGTLCFACGGARSASKDVSSGPTASASSPLLPVSGLSQDGGGFPALAGDAAPADNAVALPQIVPLHLDIWLDASKSTSRPIIVLSGRCIDRNGGCPFRPAEIPSCPNGQDFIEMTDQLQLEALVGTSTVLRGRLRMVRVVSHMSQPNCGADSSLMGAPALHLLMGEPTNSGLQDRTLLLHDARYPHAFECPGDDKTQCCGVSTDGPVLVYGRVLRASQWPIGFQIDQPRLCRFDGTRRDEQGGSSRG
jgi:hypothetical protein